MKTNSTLRLSTISLSILIAIGLYMKPSGLISQEISTIGEIYDYEVNDMFHYYKTAGNLNGYSGMWSITNIKILEKYYSSNADTLFYVRDLDYQALYFPEPEMTYDFYIDTIFYTDLNSLLNSGDVDSVYTIVNLYNGRKINYIDFSNNYSDFTMKYVDGCGKTSEEFYSEEYESESSDELVYYKKGDEEWGTAIIVSVEDSELLDGISIFPNPAKNTIKIATNFYDFDELSIFSINGIKIKSYELNHEQTTIDISELNQGLYIIQFKTKGKIITKQLIKE